MFAENSHETPDRRRSAADEEPVASTEPTTKMVALSRDECLRLLASHDFGRLAVAMDSPVIRPVNYMFDERSQSVIFRTAEGSKFHALLDAANAAFEIDGVDRASRTGWSVIVAGMTEEITSATEIRRLGRLGLATWAPGRKAHWMRIRAWTVSGRRVEPTT